MGLSPELVWQQVQGLLPSESLENLSLCVGFSGGLDSTVLLHLLNQYQKTQAKNQSFKLKAIHINHQLQKDADAWSDFCSQFCKNNNIPFQSINVDLVDTKKTGVEAAARNARYQAFSETLSDNDILLTAHHRDDQIETVLLHMLRGSGIEGAAAIDPISKFKHHYLLRPLLNFDRNQLKDYAEKENLQWIEDPSNAEVNFNRNYLRLEVLPLIEKRWPAYRQTIQRFSNNAKSATTVINDYISQDYMHCLNGEKNTLFINTLTQLSLEKRLMIIRYWIKQQNYSMPSESVLLQIHAALTAYDDANPLIEWGDAIVRRYRNEIYLLPRKKISFQNQDYSFDTKKTLTINGLGKLGAQKIMGKGISDDYVNAQIKIIFRQGGEKCQPFGRKGNHSLKKLFQEYAVPPWQREKTPIIMIDNEIAGVVGLFYCETFATKKDESGFVFELALELD